MKQSLRPVRPITRLDWCFIALACVLGLSVGLWAARADAWTSVTLTVSTVCSDGHTVAHVNASNPESQAAHVLSQTGNAWSVGDDISPGNANTRTVGITTATSFQVTVNYPGDSTHRPSNTVTATPITSCTPPTTKPPTTTVPPTTEPVTTTTSTPTVSLIPPVSITAPPATTAEPVSVTPAFTG